MKKFRIAVAGLRFGRRHVQDILANAGQTQLVAVCSMDEADRAYAEGLGTAFYTDYKRMIDEEGLDGLCVAVPPAIHMEMAVYAMERGVHIWLEKPITTTLEDADLIIEAEKRTGCRVLVGFQRRFDPSVIAMRDMIRSGENGRLAGFVIHSARYKEPDYFKPAYRHFRASGGGVLAINGAHDIDLIRYMCGEVVSVAAMKGNYIRGYEVDDTAAVVFKCAGGAVGTLFLTDTSHTVADASDFFYFEKKAFSFNCSSFVSDIRYHTLRSSREEGDETVTGGEKRIPARILHSVMADHFIQVLKGEAAPNVTPADAKASLALMLAVMKALDTGETVHL